MQFQRWISQYISDPIMREIRANGTNDDSFWFGAFNDEATNDHVVAGLHKGARTDVEKLGCRCDRRSCCWRRRWTRLTVRLIVDRSGEYIGKNLLVISQLGIDGLHSEASGKGERDGVLIGNKARVPKERILRNSHFSHIGIVVVVDGQRDVP